MLRKACLSLAVVAASAFAAGETNAQEFVSGHYRHNANGSYSYVRPHYRSHADTSFYNNWSTYPNINPYTGALGTHHRPSYSTATFLCSRPSPFMLRRAAHSQPR